jgi:hypothetical protein
MERLVKSARLSIKGMNNWRVLYASWNAASVVAETDGATVDHSDIRGSVPHNRDPSGAASD